MNIFSFYTLKPILALAGMDLINGSSPTRYMQLRYGKTEQIKMITIQLSGFAQ
jgi:hypothetical protein